MNYRIVEARFGGRPIIIGSEKLPGIKLADPMYPAWDYELQEPRLISDADVDFWSDVVDVDSVSQAVIVRTLGGEEGVQKCLAKAVKLHNELTEETK